MLVSGSTFYMTFPLCVTVNDEEDGKMKFSKDFFTNKVEQLNSSTPLLAVKRFDTFEGAKQLTSKYPLLIFEIITQGLDHPIHVEGIKGVYCLTPLAKYQFVKNPLS